MLYNKHNGSYSNKPINKPNGITGNILPIIQRTSEHNDDYDDKIIGLTDPAPLTPLIYRHQVR